MTPEEKKERAINRFWSHVEKTEGCWMWTGTVYGSNSYGRMWDGEKAIGAHRFSYELHYKPVPVGLLVLHTCHTPRCVRPDHLKRGTNADNALDMVLAGRQNRGDDHWTRRFPERLKYGAANVMLQQPELATRGSKSAVALLVEADISAIRALHEDGFTQTEIGARYGVSQVTISNIICGRTWKHVVH